MRAVGSSKKRIGRYEVVRELARGGMGVVYLARHSELGREVALKVMRGSAADKGLVQRFIAEAQTVAQLDHHNIVRVHEVGREGEDPFLVMDLIEGESLEETLKRQGPLPPAEVGEIGRALADALEHAHERSIVHRDVKPANVLIEKGGRPLLTDFGLAKDLSAADGLTREGQWVGTPGYMPPEQASGDLRRIDRKSDVYGLGGTLYALLTGRPPFETETAHETLKAIQETRPTPPSQLRPDVPTDLEAIVLKCLEKLPEARYLSARELAEDLGRFVHDEPVLARPMTRGERALRWAKRNRALAAICLGSTLLLGSLGIAVVGVFVVPQQRAASALEEHQAYRQQVLEPYACGLGSGPAPIKGELEAALRRLEEGAAGTSLEPQAKEAGELARATLRRLEGGDAPIPRATAGRSIPDLVVDLLLHLERGELTPAKQLLRTVKSRKGEYSALVELAELELLAQADPARLLERASELKGESLERAMALRPLAITRLFEEQFLAAAQGEAIDANTRRRLSASVEAAQRLGMSADELRAAKVEAGERSAPRWRERIATAVDRQQETRLVTQLAAVLRFEPVTLPGPKLDEALDSALARLIELQQESSHEEEPRRRVVDFDHKLTYEVGRPRRTWRSLRQVAYRLRGRDAESSETLFRYRYGAAWGRMDETALFQRLRDDQPTSQLGQLALWRQTQRRSRGIDGFEEQLARFEEVLALPLRDSASCYLVQSLAELTRDQAALDPELATRLRKLCVKTASWSEEHDPEDLDSIVSCWRFAERLDPEVPSPAQAKRTAALRAAATSADGTARDKHLLAIYLFRSVKDDWRLAEPEASLKVAQEALALFEANEADPRMRPDRIGAQVRVAAFVASLLRELKEGEKAWLALQPTRKLHRSALRVLEQARYTTHRLLASRELVEELARSAYASGRRPEGLSILDLAEQSSFGTTREFYVNLRVRLEEEHAAGKKPKDPPKKDGGSEDGGSGDDEED